MRRPEIAVVLLLTLLGAGLRLYQIGAQSLWLDELFSVAVARGDWMQVIGGSLAGDTNPPLYNLLLHLALSLGSDETAARFISCIFSIATVPLFYSVVRRMFDARVSLLATVILAVDPFHVLFAQEARMYGQLGFLSLACVWSFLRAWEQGRWLDWVLFIIAESLAFYTHSLAFLNLLALDVFVLTQRDALRARWPRLVMAHLGILVLFAPWLAIYLQQVARVQAGFWGNPPAATVLLTAPYLLVFGNAATGLVIAIALFAMFSLLLFGALGARRAPIPARTRLGFALAIFLVPLATLFLISLVRPMFVERTLLPASFGLYILLAWSALYARPRATSTGLAVLVLFGMVSSLFNYYTDPHVQKPPMRDAAHVLEAQFQAGDTIIHTSDSSALAFAHYAPQLPDHFLSGDPDYELATTRGRTGEIAGLVPEPLDRATENAFRIWLVVALDHNVEYQQAQVSKLKSEYSTLSAQTVGGIDLILFQNDRASHGF